MKKEDHMILGKWIGMSVVEGNGPCNEQRLNHHIKAHKNGAWVREAAKAYSQKHNN